MGLFDILGPINPFGETGWLTGEEGIIPDITGSSRAGRAATQGQREANAAYLEGMDRSIGAQREGFGYARDALSPYAQRGLGYMDQYASMAMNPNLDAIRREREEATSNLNAQLAGMGMSRSGFAAKSHAGLQADYASRMFDARMRAMQPLLGVGPSAAGGIAGAAGQLGGGMANAYQSGYGAYGGGLAQQGMNQANIAMAPFQSAVSAAGAVAPMFAGRGRG